MKTKNYLCALLAPILLAGCASGPTGPAGEAYYGKPDAMMAMIRSGQHGINERMDQGNRYLDPILPICVLMFAIPENLAAADELLTKGARLDLPCQVNPQNQYPADVALFAYGYSATPGTYYRREKAEALEKMLLRMASIGAKTEHGPLASGDDARRAMRVAIAKWNKVEADYARYQEAEAEKARLERQRSRESSSSTLAGLATIAGMAANNYAAAKSVSNAQAASAALPLARVATIPPASSASKTASTSAGTTASAQKPAAPVIGAENVKPSAPTLYANNSHLGSAGARVSNNDAAQLGARAAGVSLDFDKKPAAREAAADTSTTQSAAAPAKKTKPVEWGPIQKEAVAVCRQSTKSGKWTCNGPLDNQDLVDSETVEAALTRQRCGDGQWIPVNPTIEGVQWETYRCGRALGNGDYDVAKRYNITSVQRQFLCPKHQPFDGRCPTLYDGQDKR